MQTPLFVSSERQCAHTYILIKLSPYLHLCCIVPLIASFCSIKFPIFAVFIHISPCFFGASCSVVVSNVFTPKLKVRSLNSDYQGRAAKAKERMGGKSLSGCQETVNLANRVVGNTRAIVF